MARIRTIKPEFFRHEELQELEIEIPGQYPMMVFAALWGHCDKNGIFEWKMRQLQLDILPFIWEATGKQLGSTCEALVKHQFIKKYSFSGKIYGFIPTFKDHQRINGRESQTPSTFPNIEQMQELEIEEATGKQQGSNREASGTTGREGKGREEEGKFKDTVDKKRKVRFFPPTVTEVSDYCRERCNDVDPQLWIDHYSSNGWKVGKNNMADWKAAVRTWEKQSSNHGRRNGTTPKTFGQIQLENIKNAMQGAMNDEAGLAAIQFTDG